MATSPSSYPVDQKWPALQKYVVSLILAPPLRTPEIVAKLMQRVREEITSATYVRDGDNKFDYGYCLEYSDFVSKQLGKIALEYLPPIIVDDPKYQITQGIDRLSVDLEIGYVVYEDLARQAKEMLADVLGKDLTW